MPRLLYQGDWKSVHDPISRYLNRRALLERWPLRGAAPDCVRQAVVIPAVAEHPGLFDTLSDLDAAPPACRARTLIVVVVNNRPPPHAAPETIENNRVTLDRLRESHGVAWIDAASPGCELPPKDGVGLARKLGLDAALRELHRRGLADAPLVCLDADTRTDPHYLESIAEFFAAPKCWAAVLDYAHPLDGPAEARAAITAYECYLRCHELALAWAGSPYAFCALGSAIACTARAYAAVSGMNRRIAGEDFYFLQQLAKTGPVERIVTTTVRPAARASGRTPFGTGPRMAQSANGEAVSRFVHHPHAYAVLRAWFDIVARHAGASVETLLDAASKVDVALAAFLERDRFAVVWGKLQAQHRNAPRLLQQFHAWFDGLRSIRLLHYLRDHGYPDQDLADAVPEYIALGVFPAPPENPEDGQDLLRYLRECCRRLPPTGKRG